MATSRKDVKSTRSAGKSCAPRLRPFFLAQVSPLVPWPRIAFFLRGLPCGCVQIEADKEAKVKKHVQWKIEVRRPAALDADDGPLAAAAAPSRACARAPAAAAAHACSPNGELGVCVSAQVKPPVGEEFLIMRRWQECSDLHSDLGEINKKLQQAGDRQLKCANTPHTSLSILQAPNAPLGIASTSVTGHPSFSQTEARS